MRYRAEYAERVNRVVDHIERHLDAELSLARLAEVAHFSPFHFHRIFQALVGETLQRFVQRLRLERAATWLVWEPQRSITAIALDSGFASSATFARAFRAEFGTSATDWRRTQRDRKLGKTVRKSSKADSHGRSYGSRSMATPSKSTPNPLNMKVDVRDLAAARVAYIRHTGPYAADGELFGRLFGALTKWAGPRDLLGPSSSFLCVYHDNPEVTDEDKRRISVCLTIAEDVDVAGEIGSMRIDGGRYAVAHFRVDVDQYGAAWNQLLREWLPDSGYQPDDRLAFERFLNDPATDPEHKHEIEICLPVRPL